MKQLRVRRKRLLCCLASSLGTTVILAGLFGAGAVKAATGPTPAWAKPSVMALKQISVIETARHEPNFLSNLDCDAIDYRLPGNGTMQSGCFTWTALGALDSDSDMTIFNGTDEALPLLPYSSREVLVPWPQAQNLLALDSAATGGSYVGMYRNPLAVMRDQRDLLLKLVAKQLTAPPDLSLQDPGGKPLVINPQTMAFSDNGAWLVVETTAGAFVRINLATLDALAFAPSYGMSGSPALLKSQVAVSDDGDYVAIANNAADELKVYDLTACGGASSWQNRRCAAHDYEPFVKQHINGLRNLRHLRFVNEGLLSFEARTNDPASDAVYELAPAASISSLTDYLGLGDSFTSGEGAFDYLTGTDTADNMCHLSTGSYPLMLTRALFGTGSGHSVACSGAVISDVGNTSNDYGGQVRNGLTFEQLQETQVATLDSIMAGYKPGYVAQQRFVRQYQPAIITVSVGGNDVGFGDIIRNCVEPHVSLRLSGNDCYNTYEDRLELTRLVDRTMPRWTALYKQLAAEAPGSRVFAIGYPQTVSDTGSCALNVHLSHNERTFAAELTDYLNAAIRQAANEAGVTYVDIGQALVGHRLCESASYSVAVNGLTAGKDGALLGVRIFGHESYHPNSLGQALMEEAILKQTHNLTVSPPLSSVSLPSKILDAPKIGRQVSVLSPAKHLAPSILRPGKSVLLKAKGSVLGLKARGTYTIKLRSAEERIIGTVSSGDNGDIGASVALPADIEAGSQTIDITGENQAGEPVDVYQPVYVPFSADDADGDGLPDLGDSCPGAVNSGRDADKDGVDDACDNYIGQPLAVGQGDGTLGVSGGPEAGTGSQVPGNGAANPPAIATILSSDDGQSAKAGVVNHITTSMAVFRPAASPNTPRPKPAATLLPVMGWPFRIKLLAMAWLAVLIAITSRLAYRRSRIESSVS